MSDRETPYQQLSIADKRRQDLAKARAPSRSCPKCGTQVMRVDLLAHLEHRCPGRREPGPGDRWITFRQARDLGIPKRTLVRWTRAGHIQFKGPRGDRLYLEGDLIDRIAERRGNRRR